MIEFWQKVRGWLAADAAGNWLTALLVLVVGWLVARVLRRVFERLLGGRLNPQQAMLGSRVVYYGVLAVAWISALDRIDLADFKVLLGAAGVLTVALGFAAQTSASNLISGLFLVGEKAFQVGDLVQVGSTTGIVASIDLLSVKLRRFDNVVVRIPNETMLKSEIANFHRHPIRRLDLTLGVAYKEKVSRVREILLDVAAKNPYALDEPAPLFFFNGYGDSAVLLRFSVWFKQESFPEATNRIQEEIYEALTEAGVEIPFPHVSLYTGSVTEPFPVRFVDSSPH